MIDVAPNIDAYFEQAVQDAIQAQRVEATKAAEHYLALLLSGVARGELAADPFERPLTFLLHDALEARGVERFERLRTIGDGVLYACGFFGEAVERRGADRDYVMHVGSSAYGHASAMLRLGAGGETGHDVLSELAEGFSRFVAVFSEVANAALASATNPGSVLRLYERWQATGSGRLAEALAGLGLAPVRTSGGLH
jgi:hypothetical protein